MEFIVTKKAKRPASSEEKCFYCHQKIGGYHKSDCVLIQRKVLVRATIEYKIDVPSDWDKDMIEFHRNESTWCSNNMIKELTKASKKNCLCDRVVFTYLKDVGKPYLDEI